MTTIDVTQTVAELAHSHPGAARVFESFGIDYCCRGRQSLRDAVVAAQLPIADVTAALERSASERTHASTPSEPVALIAHIVDTHHTFTRRELLRLAPLAEKVLRVHGTTRPELGRVAALLDALTRDLVPHMSKEEQILFPYIERLARGERERPFFGTVENPIRMMHLEHESVGALLEELEQITDRYTPPPGACGSYGALYAGLKALQADIHQHVHLENHVLFPAAVALEHTT